MGLRSERGQGLIEYVILVALIAVAAIGTVELFQKNLRVQLANVTNALSGKKDPSFHEGREITGHINKKDFSSFMNGAASSAKDE